ncbi:MAG TPA: glycosyltransferase family 2 protein [Thermoanaerobaculia bacterium]|nr:glycosyltransferase family 2 protein [Thermoanaerobaculia bacterium]
MSEAPELSVVLPVHDEEAGIAECLERVGRVLDGLGLSSEIVVVDDGSADGTWEVLRRVATGAEQGGHEVVPIRLSRNFGKESAICAGLDACRGAAVVVMDADLQHPPELIPRMVELWRDQGYVLVEAVKERRGREGWIARLGSFGFYQLFGALTGARVEGASDFKLLARPVLDEWRRLGESETFFRGLVAWLGFERAEVPFAVPERRDGASRWSALQRARLAVLALTSFSSLPLQLITVAGVALFAITGALTAQALWQKWQGVAVEGFTTVIILVSLIGATLMVSLGIIGLYVARIYDEVKRRPRYVVSEGRGRSSGPFRRG